MQTAQTEENWNALSKVAVTYFENVYFQNPHLSVEQLFAMHDIPSNTLLCELAVQVGFKFEESRNVKSLCEFMQSNVNTQSMGQSSTGQNSITPNVPAASANSHSLGYGQAAYGTAAYGNRRKVSDGKSSVARRTTVNGQLSYRGYRYSLGCEYRCRLVYVRERPRELVVSCNGQQPLHVSRFDVI